MQHLIKKQVINLTLDKKLDAFRMQHMVSQHYWSNIVPVLQKVFDEISNEDEIIELDKMEIDLGVFSEKSIVQNEWSTELQSKIEKLLSELTDQSSSTKTIFHKSKRLSVCRQWLFYMENGYLPWNTIKVDDQWYGDVLEALAVDFESADALKNLIRTDFSVVRRMVSQHPEFFLLKLTEILTAEKHNDLHATINELSVVSQFLGKQKKTNVTESEKEVKGKLWLQVLVLAATEKNCLTRKLTEQTVLSFLNENSIINKLPLKISSKLTVTLPLIKQFSKELRAQESEEKISVTNKKIKYGTAEKENVNQQQGDDAQFIGAPQNIFSGRLTIEKEKFSNTESNKNIADTIDEEGIFVTNAGVVLLHPFLSSLFNRLKMVCEGKFMDLKSQQKALHLLHYLTTGNINVPEHELVIAKVLCAYPLEEPVDMEIEISKEELSEADDMLAAVIQQWEILKNTSAEGLREGFLQRNGKLCSRTCNLNLQIETNSIDILLDHLPWNLSMIKLPWMKDILRVEWR